MFPRIWRDYHESFACYGREKTVNTIGRKYWCKNMNGLVVYAKSISPCCLRNPDSTTLPRAPLQPLPISKSKFGRVHLDFGSLRYQTVAEWFVL